MKEANKYSEHINIANYALLTLYSIARKEKKCEAIIDSFEKKLTAEDVSVPLPRLHRILEDIDLSFLREETEYLYERLRKLAEENDKKEDYLKK